MRSHSGLRLPDLPPLVVAGLIQIALFTGCGGSKDPVAGSQVVQPDVDRAQLVDTSEPIPKTDPPRIEDLVSGQVSDDAPSVILITVDTLRADYLGCYGHSKPTSPAIDRFAEDSLRFEFCSSHAPFTGPSCASLMTGFLPHETQVYFNSDPVSEDLVALPEFLAHHGYRCGAVSCSSALSLVNGYAQGFEFFRNDLASNEFNRSTVLEDVAERGTDLAIEALEALRNDRFFLWLHYQDPHGPYIPPEDFGSMFHDADVEPRILPVNRSVSGKGGIPSYQQLGTHTEYEFYVSRYEGEIRYLDTHFQRLIDSLKEMDLYDDSLIIFTADHGEGMGEHNYYFAHGDNLYRQLLHVPLIVKDRNAQPGTRTDLAQHLDIVPTVLRSIGLEVGDQFRGRDLLGETGSAGAIIAERRYDNLGRDPLKSTISILDDDLKLIYNPSNGRSQLFDLQQDPAEEVNLRDHEDYQARLRDLKSRMLRIRGNNRLGHQIVTKPRTLSEAEKRQLRSLGYLD